MNDIPENQEINMDDINFDEFENFDTSEEMQNLGNEDTDFNTSDFDNYTFEDQSNEETTELTDNVSADFSFDEMNDVDTMFEGAEDNQEPYFENVAEEMSAVEEFVEEPIISEDVSTMEEFVEEPVVSEEMSVTEEFVEEPVVSEEMSATEEFVEELVMSEDVSAVEEFVEDPIMSEDVSAVEEFVEEPVIYNQDHGLVNAEGNTSSEMSFEADACMDIDNIGAYRIVSPQNLKYIQWYSGNLEDEVYEFDKYSESAEFVGTESCNTIHVNVGYDTYGWNVQFSDGVMMSLRDVKEYQIRNGKLPNSSGRIVYGHNVL